MTLRYFKISEFDCPETGENKMDPDFLKKLDELRHKCGFPFVISSGYRGKNHSIEKKKHLPGLHTQGIASDILCSGGNQRYIIVKNAIDMGFRGIGVYKKHVHVDDRNALPVMWYGS